MTYLESIADNLAQKVLADPANIDDSTVIDMMAATISASSATLQETFLTAVRIRRAEMRAKAVLEKHVTKAHAKD